MGILHPMIQLVKSQGGWGGENGPFVLSCIVKGNQRHEKELLLLLLAPPSVVTTADHLAP